MSKLKQLLLDIKYILKNKNKPLSKERDFGTGIWHFTGQQEAVAYMRAVDRLPRIIQLILGLRR
jgi:hypothetical protein